MGAVTAAPDGSVYVAGVDDASIAPTWARPAGSSTSRARAFCFRSGGVENLSCLAGSLEIYGLAVDLSGNAYATDFNGRRILKFVP